MNKTLEPRVRSKFLSLMMAARVRSNLFSLMMAASTSQLDLSRKKSQWHIVINFFLKNTSSPVNVMEKWKNSWQEGERKRGWRKRKEENGVQAPNRAEIILDHKGWNSIENLGYSKNCQSIVEKGKRPDEQDVGVEGQVQVLTAWPEKKRIVNVTLSLIFFLKNTSYLWMWWKNSLKMLEGEVLCEDAKLKRVEEELICVAYDIVYISLKKEKWKFMNFRGEEDKGI